MKILFLGDIVGKIGRRVVKERLPFFVDKYNIDFVIANGENATHGKGLIQSHYDELINDGIDVITLGNHYLSKSQITKYIDGADRLVRPLNITRSFGGEGSIVFDVDGITIRITNILGSAFMNETVVDPYSCLIDMMCDSEQTNIHIIDFHAEATGEKITLAREFDGKVTAIFGTHTHVQTKDAQILPKGTAYITDVGMCGFADGCLGFAPDTVIKKNLYGEISRYEVPDEGRGLFSAVVIDVDVTTGLTKEIFPIYFLEEAKQ